MSKLAARLADARRSGVYRVESTDAIEEAAAVNAFSLARFALDTIEVSALESLSTRALARSADG